MNRRIIRNLSPRAILVEFSNGLLYKISYGNKFMIPKDFSFVPKIISMSAVEDGRFVYISRYIENLRHLKLEDLENKEISRKILSALDEVNSVRYDKSEITIRSEYEKYFKPGELDWIFESCEATLAYWDLDCENIMLDEDDNIFFIDLDAFEIGIQPFVVQDGCKFSTELQNHIMLTEAGKALSEIHLKYSIKEEAYDIIYEK